MKSKNNMHDVKQQKYVKRDRLTLKNTRIKQLHVMIKKMTIMARNTSLYNLAVY